MGSEMIMIFPLLTALAVVVDVAIDLVGSGEC